MLPSIKSDVFWQKSQHPFCKFESKHRKNDKSNATLICIWPYCGLLACSLPFLRRVLDLSWSRGRKLDENRVKVDKRPSSFTAAACCCRRRGASVAPYAPRYSCCCCCCSSTHTIDHSFLPMPFCLPLLLWYGFAQCSIYCFLMLACSTLRILITYEF